jgi:succinyl-CoA synthetase beta subunit/citryl-CoA synthetase large subunit
MRFLEHQSKKLLAGFGLQLTQATVVDSTEAARRAATEMGCPVVLKAQVPFGGRGKAGAIKFAAHPDEAAAAAAILLGMELRGHAVSHVSIEPKIEFQREFYAGMAWDTSAKLPIALLSDAGGVEIESAHRMVKRTFDPWTGLGAFEGREMASELGLTDKRLVVCGQFLAQLSQAFLATDAFTLEVNPVVETKEGTWLGLDAHLEIDDDAAYRQKQKLAPLGAAASGAVGGRSATPLELEAERIDAMDHRGVAGRLVEFEGDLALLIGGGGASLTVFDAIRRHGGKPANYCEVGGNPTEEKVAALTALLLSKPGVRHLAVIMNVVNNTRADVMARGVLLGAKKVGVKPSEAIRVFRIPGSWEQEAREMLAAEGITALGREISLDEAARLAVKGGAK